CIVLRPLRGVIRKIGTIQRRLAWPLHKDDTLFRSGRPTGLNIYALFFQAFYNHFSIMVELVRIALLNKWRKCSNIQQRI
ncbi:hypothetical protein B0H19DRAFT_928351, partial [Mycena capillaripes]